ncbi:hypothetical protein [Sinorhizobium fredii]|uniref:hypothetical protein n=1 Tax=Rhizobium fredii TaxID=380 RepID=UPI0013E8B1EF|nr:hypothetical protein [Sinorhizobium fredii]
MVTIACRSGRHQEIGKFAVATIEALTADVSIILDHDRRRGKRHAENEGIILKERLPSRFGQLLCEHFVKSVNQSLQRNELNLAL